jgi:hypothetical protein
MKKMTRLQIKKSRTSLQIGEKKENRKSWRLKNEGCKERLKLS